MQATTTDISANNLLVEKILTVTNIMGMKNMTTMNTTMKILHIRQYNDKAKYGVHLTTFMTVGKF